MVGHGPGKERPWKGVWRETGPMFHAYHILIPQESHLWTEISRAQGRETWVPGVGVARLLYNTLALGSSALRVW
jgi:hypothetical protein